jgi:hypothetical protein
MTPMPTRRRSLPILLGAAALLVTLPALAEPVRTDHDREADFSNRKTWAWKAGTEAPNPLTEQKIHIAVGAAMFRKGLKEVAESPDLWVVTHVSTSMDARIDVTAFGYGGGWSWNGWGAWGPTNVRIRDSTTGILLVDILDGPKATLIWRGIASDKVYDYPDPDKLAKKIDKVVRQMFEEFPPPPEKKK